MAKFFGKVGYVRTYEDPIDSGIWKDKVIEVDYYGDVIKKSRRWENGESVNDNLSVSNEISIITDDFAIQNLQFMKYVIWMDQKWKIVSVDIDRPRMTLSLGGLYNG